MKAGAEEAVLRRIKRNAVVLAAAGDAVALAVSGVHAALSLTIAAAIVILSFSGFERVTERILKPRTGMRASDFLAPAAGVLALAVLVGLLLRWKAFHLGGGIAGFSVVVAAIGWEGLRGLRGE